MSQETIPTAERERSDEGATNGSLVGTLADLVLASRSTLDAETRARLDASPELRDLRRRLASASPDTECLAPSDFVARHLRSLLDIPVAAHVLVQVWNDAGLFHGFRGPDPEDGVTVDVPLDDHPVHVEFAPALEVQIGGTVAGTIPFRVSAEFDVSDLVVCVRDGVIVGVRSGRLEGKTEIRCGDLVLLAERVPAREIPGALAEADEGRNPTRPAPRRTAPRTSRRPTPQPPTPADRRASRARTAPR